MAFVGEHRVDPLSTGVERRADPVDLGDVGPGERLQAEVAFAEPSRPSRQTFEWAGQLSGLDRRQTGGGDDRSERQHQQHVELVGEVLVERVRVGADDDPGTIGGDSKRFARRTGLVETVVDQDGAVLEDEGQSVGRPEPTGLPDRGQVGRVAVGDLT